MFAHEELTKPFVLPECIMIFDVPPRGEKWAKHLAHVNWHRYFVAKGQYVNSTLFRVYPARVYRIMKRPLPMLLIQIDNIRNRDTALRTGERVLLPVPVAQLSSRDHLRLACCALQRAADNHTTSSDAPLIAKSSSARSPISSSGGYQESDPGPWLQPIRSSASSFPPGRGRKTTFYFV